LAIFNSASEDESELGKRAEERISEEKL